MLHRSYFLFFTILFAIHVMYYTVGLSYLESLLFSNESSAVKTMLYQLYPRLEIELQRFPVEFFVKKASQLLLRLDFLLVVSFLLLKSYKSDFLQLQSKIKSLTKLSIKKAHAKVAISVFYIGMFLLSKDWLLFLIDYQRIAALYRPISFYVLLPYPSLLALTICWVIYVVSTILILFASRPFYYTLLSSSLFIYLQGLLYCFEKTNHAFATMGYAAILMPWLAYQLQNNAQQQENRITALPILMIQLSVGMAYLQSGLEKVFAMGSSWFNQHTLPAIELHNIELTPVLLFSALLFQLSFVFFIWHKPMKWVFLCLGFLFHFGTVGWLGVGAILNPWLFVYGFWLIPTYKAE